MARARDGEVTAPADADRVLGLRNGRYTVSSDSASAVIDPPVTSLADTHRLAYTAPPTPCLLCGADSGGFEMPRA
ncbi:hypothetical protein DFH11DRAFT_1730810 [Phellopilus nigrolimitatus]|nr:hypothetical protein DFH11DRAFT_1730810 [Phellopilus nigrolimitatus]